MMRLSALSLFELSPEVFTNFLDLCEGTVEFLEPIVLVRIVVMSVFALIVTVPSVDFDSDVTADLMAATVSFPMSSLPQIVSRIANDEAADTAGAIDDFSLLLSQELFQFVEVAVWLLSSSSGLSVGSSPTLFESMELLFEACQFLDSSSDLGTDAIHVIDVFAMLLPRRRTPGESRSFDGRVATALTKLGTAGLEDPQPGARIDENFCFTICLVLHRALPEGETLSRNRFKGSDPDEVEAPFTQFEIVLTSRW